MGGNVKICAVQMPVIHNDVMKNRETSVKYLREAGKGECDFIVFPEIFLEGVVRSREAVEKLSRPVPGEYTEWFTPLAEEYGTYIVMGSTHERDGEKFYNTSVLIDPSGNIVGKYRKNFLWAAENDVLTPSKERPVFDTKFGKVGINICWDLGFPEVANDMAKKGAKILFAPSFWCHEDKYGMVRTEKFKEMLHNIDPEPGFVDTIVASRAYENEMLVVYVNPYGEYNINGFTIHPMGRSQMAMPFFGTIARMDDRPGILKKEVDLTWLDVAEEVYRIRETYLRR